MSILEAKGLCKNYGGGNILSDIDFQINVGEFVAVMGQSGGGKSTLLYCISGMDEPSSGKIYFDGADMTDMSDKQMQELRLKRMGFVFQKPSFLKNLSIIDNIVYPAFQLGEADRSEIVKEAMALMEEMGISSVAEHDIYKVSGGQLQRAAICRAMINHPDILFGDELTGALNSSTTREVSGIIDNINKKGTTVLLVTHDANVAVHADKVIYLEDGRIMDTLNLGKYDEGSAGSRDAEMKTWLKKMKF
ncbi:MAG: ABC transporter ATP-binding protein [Lachnospiraceae bacterium]|nr:ABC transporter ATP-binding protein [Lachnospiraceae bacterium]